MATVNIVPMPLYCRKIKPIYRQMPPPLFPEGNPTSEDIELARELFMALDEESKVWYRSRCFKTFEGL